MKVLVDTDVLLDVALNRRPHVTHAGLLLNALEQKPGDGYVAWHSLSNFYYLTAGGRNDRSARAFIADLTTFLSIPVTTSNELQFALQLPVSDFEDAMQVAAAVSAGAEVVVTRNLRDYAKSPIRALSPQQALERL